MNITRNLLVALFLLLAVPAWSATYKVSKTDGAADFASPEALGTFILSGQTTTNTGGLKSGDIVQFDNCDTYSNKADMLLLGLAQWDTNNPVTFTSYGACSPQKPTWNITSEFTTTWTEVLPNIYKASDRVSGTVLYHIPHIFMEDGVRMDDPIQFSIAGDITTASASMSPGSYTVDYGTFGADVKADVYIYPSTGTPADHTYTYGSRNYVFGCNVNQYGTYSDDNCGGLIIDGLEFHNVNSWVLDTGGISASTKGRGVTVRNSRCVQSGGFILGIGDNGTIHDNTSDDCAGPSENYPDSNPTFSVANGNTIDIYDNLIENNRRGTGIEINFNTVNFIVHDNNIIEGEGHCLEAYNFVNDGSYYRNYCKTSKTRSGSTGLILSGGIPSTNGAYNIKAYSNVFIGQTQACYRQQEAAHDNEFYNNTCVAASSGWSVAGIYMYDGAYAGTGFTENNIFYSEKSAGQKMFSIASGSTVDSDNNLFYTAVAPSAWATVAGTNYATKALFTTATTEEANGIEGDPTISGDYTLLVGSPAINAGVSIADLVGTTDIEGNPRIVDTVDIGAYEYQTPDPDPTPGGNGKVQLRGFRGRIRIH